MTTTADKITDTDPGPDTDEWKGGRSLAALQRAVAEGHLRNVPEALRVALDALTRAEDTARELQTGGHRDAVHMYVTRLTADVLAGKPLPENLGKQLHDEVQAAEQAHTANVAAERLLANLRQRIPEAVTRALPDLLDGIRAEVEQSLTDARAAVKALDGLDVGDGEAVAAATAKQHAAIADLRAASGRYNRARQMQRTVLTASHIDPPGTTSVSVGHTWGAVFDAGAHEFRRVVGTTSTLPVRGMRWFDRITALVARTDVVVPTPEEMHRAWLERPSSSPVTYRSTKTTADGTEVVERDADGREQRTTVPAHHRVAL